MKKIIYTNKFKKKLKKRFANQPNAREKIDEAIKLFNKGQRGAPLNDHPLKGSKYGLRSFSAAGDIRILYEETEDLYIFTDIGSHNQVY